MASRSAESKDFQEQDFLAAFERHKSASEKILVAEIVRPHGLRGEVKIEIHSDVEDRFDPGRQLLLTLPGEPTRVVRVIGNRPVRGGALIHLRGVENRQQAELLRRGRLEVEASQVPAAPEGCFYYYQLTGCVCHDLREGELGSVVDVVEDGGGVLLKIKRLDDEVLVPFVGAFLKEVDVEGKRIELELPQGLLETCASKF